MLLLDPISRPMIIVSERALIAAAAAGRLTIWKQSLGATDLSDRLSDQEICRVERVTLDGQNKKSTSVQLDDLVSESHRLAGGQAGARTTWNSR